MSDASVVPTRSRPTILFVDDDAHALKSLTSRAHEQGYVTRMTQNTEDALQQLRNDFCPILVADAVVPTIGSLALCRELRARRWPGYIYTIVLLSPENDHGVVTVLDAGADDCLRKDAPTDELLARLRVAERILTLEFRLRRLLKSKARQAASDALTGLPNRRAFAHQIDAEGKRAHRYGGALSVLLIDVDHFKLINDRYGHLVGDEVLRHLAATLRRHLPRASDIVARFGGDEFAVVLPQTDGDAAVMVAERLRAAVACASITTNLGELSLTVSIGIGSSAPVCVDISQPTTLDLLEDADRALYESKREGRNRVTFGTRNMQLL